MQRIIHEYTNKSRVFNMMENLYTYVSDCSEDMDEVLWLDKSFYTLIQILQSNIMNFNPPKLKPFDLPRVEASRCDTREVTVCLSGGKDSAAVAFYYKKLGFKVHLYHMCGINRTYSDEKKAAQEIAKYLDCELFVDKVQVIGNSTFIEHPMKNYIIANGALHYCLANNYSPIISFGNFTEAKLDLNPFDVCAGDCIDMWVAYKRIIKHIIPRFDLLLPLETNSDTFEILSEDWDLFGKCISCMSPTRFRAHWKHRTETKYNVRLFENRCGCCWKCCVEAIWLMDTGKIFLNEAYYTHCIGILIQTIFKESDEKVSVQEAWENFMFYPITDAYANNLLNYKILYLKTAACKLRGDTDGTV